MGSWAGLRWAVARHSVSFSCTKQGEKCMHDTHDALIAYGGL